MQKLSFIIAIVIAGVSLAQSPHGKNFNISCEECHSTDKWDIEYDKLDFDHSITNFNLEGTHKNISCRNCHESIVFSEVEQQCLSCHTDIHQNSLDKDCGQCHTSESWLIKNINDIHRSSRFPLEGNHRQADCIDCHRSSNNLLFETIGIECIDCHIVDYQSAEEPNHIQAGFSTECQDCHRINDFSWNMANIVHDFFPLTNGHQIDNCFQCHSQNGFEGLDSDCYSCHQSDYSSAQDPNHTTSGFSINCQECHTTNSGWHPASFKEHDNFFQLVGAHKIIENDCSKCHSVGYTNTPNECIGCHRSDYESTIDPSHQAAGFGSECELCHNSSAWEPAEFDHDNEFFPIYSGQHNGEWNDCSDCHTNSQDFQVFECITCHEHNQSEMNSKHSDINGYIYESGACYACHPTGSEEGGFNHSATSFPLEGAHRATECSECHSGSYQGTSSECISCHNVNYQNSTQPNHTQINLSQNCEECHTSNAWQPSQFDHAVTGFQLIGGHNLTLCSDCHNVPVENTTSECFVCHESDYSEAPEHASQNYPKTCEDCHNTNNWEETDFDHSATQFALTGAHINANCNNCHSTGYAGTTTICGDCHISDYNNSQNPNHTDLSLSNNCEECHTSNAWQPSQFDHAVTGFQLIGGHNLTLCSDCHNVPVENTTSECFVCHESDYSEAPEHASQNYPKTCEDCHNTNNWEETDFDHSATQFALTGAHINANCNNCHSTGYAGTTTICGDCHISDYNNSQNPNHTNLSLSNNCEECHTTNYDWQPATFSIHNDFYLLQGAHSSIANDCSVCHNDDYNNTSNDCFGCHQQNYNSTTDPVHSASGFGTACEDCHSQNAWEPSTFDHDNQYFPIYSGKHKSEWNSCSDCHNNQSNFGQFSCIDCHEHNQNDMDDKHKEEDGYLYDSYACYDCHPSGTEDINLHKYLNKIKVFR